MKKPARQRRNMKMSLRLLMTVSSIVGRGERAGVIVNTITPTFWDFEFLIFDLELEFGNWKFYWNLEFGHSCTGTYAYDSCWRK